MNAEPTTHRAGKNETKLRIAETREQLEETIGTIRGRLDVKTHALRAWATLRRDVSRSPLAYVLLGVVVSGVGVYVVTSVVRERGHRG
jgi:hypothetical protein